jgi:hypothetical protein
LVITGVIVVAGSAFHTYVLVRLWVGWVAAFLLVFTLIAGYRAYARRVVSYGDDLTTYGPAVWHGAGEYVHDAYTKLNGRLTSHLTSAAARVVLAPSRFTPESYPWWLLFALTEYLGLMAAVALAFATQRAAELPAAAGLLIAAIVLMAWGSTPALYETSLYAVCIGFAAGACALASGAAVAASMRPRWPRWVAAGALFVYAALCSEQLLVSALVVFTAITVALLASRRLSARQAVADIALWLALTALSCAIYFGSPGQKIRNPHVQVGFAGAGALLKQVPRWLAQSIREEYLALFGSDRFAVAAHCILAALAVALLLATWRRRDAVSRGAILACGFGAAFHASLAHLLFSPHFPGGRSRFYPALLLAMFIVVTIATAIAASANRALRRGAAVAGLIVACALAARHTPEIRRLYREAVWSSDIRQDLRASMLARCRAGARNFRLTNCPFNIDAEWGFTAYLGWHGCDGAKVAPPGLSLGSPELDRAAAPIENREVPPLLPLDAASPRTAYSRQPVRTIMHPGPSLVEFGGWDTDFWVTPKVAMCRVLGVYNPNSGGGDYRESFEYHVYVGRAWDADHLAAVLEPQLVGRVHASAVETSIGWIHDGKLTKSVPMTAFDDPDWNRRPYLRVSISRAVIGYAAWVSDVRLRCE